MICACGKEPKVVKGNIIYPHRLDLVDKNFWLCECGAYVGCHNNTDRPLGTPANAELRKLRSKCHKAFDILWKDNPFTTRKKAYQALQKRMDLSAGKCHIGIFNKKQCIQLLGLYE